jgi:hypothetical protein
MDPTPPDNARDDAVAESIRYQAESCRRVGSPMYAQLLTGLCADYVAGGITYEMLSNVSSQPMHDALSLRYLATAHQLALAGRAPGLAEAYGSCGGVWQGDDLTPAFLRAVEEHRDMFAAGVRRNVQTNEVGRAAALVPGFSLIHARHGLPLATLEIGASAGLLSRWMHMRFDTGTSSTGPSDSAVSFGAEWWRQPAPPLAADVRVVSARASDIAPFDVRDADHRLRMHSFVWPDNAVRRDRLQAAIDLACTHPIPVVEADAGAWLRQELDGTLPSGVATVVFHSIVWQYLPQTTRESLRQALNAAAATATPRSPLLWLRFEPDTIDHAALRLTTWPGGTDELLAHAGYHGADVRWLLSSEPASDAEDQPPSRSRFEE